MAKNCPICYASQPDSADVCDVCGAALDVPDTLPAAEPAPTETTRPTAAVTPDPAGTSTHPPPLPSPPSPQETGSVATAGLATEGPGAGWTSTSATESIEPANTASETGTPWLERLGSLAEVFAPFVGRQAPNVHPNPTDRRGRLAATLAAVGIILATMQVIASFFDIITRPLGPLSAVAAIMPYLILGLFVTAILLLAFVVIRAPTAAGRKRALRVLFLILVPGVAWGIWWTYEKVTPPTNLLVVIAEFDSSKASRKVDFSRRIHDQVQTDLKEVGANVEVRRANEVFKDASDARAKGEERKATLVIWGWYDDAGVSSRVEVLQTRQVQPEALNLSSLFSVSSASAAGLGAGDKPPSIDLTRMVRAPAVMTDFDLFVRNGPQQVTYVSTAMLGMVLYQSGDPARALALFEKSIANAGAGGTEMLGLESLYFSRGLVYFEQNRIANASADWLKALGIKPDMYQAHFNLALAYGETCDPARRLDQAIAEAETAARLRPNDNAAHRLRGDLYRVAGKLDQAIDALQTAIRLDEGDAMAYELLATSQRAAGQPDLAATNQQKAVALREKAARANASPSNKAKDGLQAMLALGDSYITTGDYAKALAQFKAAEKMAPDNARVQRGLGRTFYFSKNFVAAEAAYQRGVNLAPEDANGHVLLGLILAERGDYGRSAQELERAAALDPCGSDTRLVLGYIYLQKSDYPRAIRECQAALAIDPQSADAHYAVGVALYLQGQNDDAVKPLQTAISLRPDFVKAHIALSSVYMELKDYGRAVAERETAVTLAPAEAEYWRELAYAYEKAMRLDDAVTAYRKALAIEDLPDTHAYLALVYYQKQDYDSAIAEYQQVLVTEPNNAVAYAGIGQAYSAQGKWEESAEAYRQSLARDDTSIGHSQLAYVYTRQGKTDAATAEYQKAVSIDPKNWQAALALARMMLEQGNSDEAIKYYQATLAARPDLLEGYSGIAAAETKRCNPSGATQAASAAMSVAPNQSANQVLLASTYEAQGRATEAAQIYANMRTAPVTDTLAHLVAAQWLVRANQLTEAEREIQRILETPNLAPVFVSLAHQQLGQINLERDQLLAAESEFQQALVAAPNNAQSATALGDVAMRRGDAAAALAAYDRAVALLPVYAQVMGIDQTAPLSIALQAGRGLAMQKLGDTTGATGAFDAAVSQAQKMLARSPKWAQANFSLGFAYLARGDTTKAAAAFSDAAQCDKSMVDARVRVEAALAKIR